MGDLLSSVEDMLRYNFAMRGASVAIKPTSTCSVAFLLKGADAQG
jgi:hypothetical protein